MRGCAAPVGGRSRLAHADLTAANRQLAAAILFRALVRLWWGRARWRLLEAVATAASAIASEAEERLFEYLGAVTSTEPLVIAGQAIGLRFASECLLALLPSNEVAAFCVQLGAMIAAED